MASDCVVLEGGGIGPRPPPTATCDTSSTGGTGGDTAALGRLEGTPCGCASGSVGSGPLWLLVLVVALRRVLVLLLLVAAPRARAVDAENLDPDANGRWLVVREGDLGDPWSVQAGVYGSVMRSPAVLRAQSSESELLSLVSTVTAAAAVNLDVVQVQVVLPYHPVVLSDTVDPQAAWGDVGLRVAVPMVDRRSDTRVAWTVGLETRSGAPELLLGDAGSGWAALSVDTPLVQRVRFGASGALHLRQDVALPGSVWGRSIELAGGLSYAARSDLVVALETFGQIGLETTNAATVPFEALGRARFGDRVGVHAAVGGGIGRGIGNPAWRVVVGVDTRALGGDRDGDRRPDMRDLCPGRPEDLDHHGDLEGCPDPDNDRDGLLDAVDACPDDAEVVNAWRDEDGCPDARASLTVRVPVDVDIAVVSVDGAPAARLFAGETETVELDPGPHRVEATAEGYLPYARALDLPEGPSLELIRLDPVPRSGVVVRVRGVDGAPLPARIRLDGSDAGEAADLRAPRRPGPVVVEADLPGYAPARLEVEVPPGEDVAAELVLARLEVARVGQELVVADEVRFGLDDARVDADSPALDRLAEWLRDHPEVRLVRIEGHADEIGEPAYNYALSVRRADAVRDALVRRGIASDRLIPIGAGEAVAAGRARAVGFLVLVWDEVDGVSDPQYVLPTEDP